MLNPGKEWLIEAVHRHMRRGGKLDVPDQQHNFITNYQLETQAYNNNLHVAIDTVHDIRFEMFTPLPHGLYMCYDVRTFDQPGFLLVSADDRFYALRTDTDIVAEISHDITQTFMTWRIAGAGCSDSHAFARQAMALFDDRGLTRYAWAGPSGPAVQHITAMTSIDMSGAQPVADEDFIATPQETYSGAIVYD